MAQLGAAVNYCLRPAAVFDPVAIDHRRGYSLLSVMIAEHRHCQRGNNALAQI
jgi:hypothetical protein